MFHQTVLENPVNCRFEGQNDDEDIILLVRAHLITNLGWIILSIFVFLLPFILPKIAPFFGFDLSLIPEQFRLVFLIIDYLLVLVITFEGFLGWYFNVNILTNSRLIDIDFYSALSKNVDTALLQDVQEANANMAGLMGLIFNYGDVYVQTAAAQVQVDFKDVPNPNFISDKIMDAAQSVRP